jgi:RNA polymerase sigma factor (sigma-70 family)
MRLTADQVAAFRAGDEQLFRMVVQECSPRLMALLRSFASDGDDAWDLLQEVWSRAYAKRHTFRGDGPLLSWLYAVSRNVCLGMARTRRAVARAEAAHGAPPAPETPDEAADRASVRRSLRAFWRAAAHVRRPVISASPRAP